MAVEKILTLAAGSDKSTSVPLVAVDEVVVNQPEVFTLKLMLDRLLQLLKALLPINDKDEHSLKSTEIKLVQYLKASLSISVKLSPPIIKLVIFSHELKNTLNLKIFSNLE